METYRKYCTKSYFPSYIPLLLACFLFVPFVCNYLLSVPPTLPASYFLFLSIFISLYIFSFSPFYFLLLFLHTLLITHHITLVYTIVYYIYLN